MSSIKNKHLISLYSCGNVKCLTYLNPIVSTATDMCRGCCGHLYKLRSSNGIKSTSWKMKQSHLCICNATKNPTFMRAARLNKPSEICSTTKIPYSICCFISSGCMFFRKTGKWSARSRYGMTIATRSFGLHSCGLYQPPGSKRSRNRFSIEDIGSYSVSALIGPIKFGGVIGHAFKPNFVINFAKNWLLNDVVTDVLLLSIPGSFLAVDDALLKAFVLFLFKAWTLSKEPKPFLSSLFLIAIEKNYLMKLTWPIPVQFQPLMRSTSLNW